MENKPELIQNNNYSLDLLLSKSSVKRIKREFINMYKLYDEVIIELTQNPEDFIVIVIEYVDGKKLSYKFVINVNYPFSIPKIFFNNNSYKQLLISKTSYEIINLKKLKGIDCFCCQSITCQNNWSPGNTLTDIIDEIKYFKKIKKDFVLKIMANKIKLKYLIPDIDLDCWLL